MKPLTGECPCGALSFSARVPAVWTVYCHCNECRYSAGAPVSLWVGFPSRSVDVSGPTLWRPGLSLDVTRGFCGLCGAAALYRDRSMLADETYLNGALAHDPLRLDPAGHAFWSERVSFYLCGDELPKWDTYSRARRDRLILI
ncbi:GFA family protein [Acuticoccus sp. I52.16.1]|uniref:GFA family protein n=1 Tax=Acuticoccus sp. I52.16.1 TaxID=2928472 RepID=UPI001FD0C7D3|nr:GFA family protein [Acuticoccus sp. I52.16.1]UOM33978.1 GFA family protein [Acuticoccus sp. I52.16.1]